MRDEDKPWLSRTVTETRWKASRFVGPDYIAASVGEYGLPTRESAERDGEPGDPMYRIDISVVRVFEGELDWLAGEQDCA